MQMTRLTAHSKVTYSPLTPSCGLTANANRLTRFGYQIPLLSLKGFTRPEFDALNRAVKLLDVHARGLFLADWEKPRTEEAYVDKGERLYLPVVDDDTMNIRLHIVPSSAGGAMQNSLVRNALALNTFASPQPLRRPGFRQWLTQLWDKITNVPEPQQWQEDYSAQGITRTQFAHRTLNATEKRIAPSLPALGLKVDWPQQVLPPVWRGWLMPLGWSQYPANNIGHLLPPDHKFLPNGPMPDGLTVLPSAQYAQSSLPRENLNPRPQTETPVAETPLKPHQVEPRQSDNNVTGSP
jgi:hypothetical protein